MGKTESDEPDTDHEGARQVISVDLAPLHLGRESVVRKEPSTALRRLGDSALLYSPAFRVSLVANPSVAALWDCFDGSASLSEIAEDVSEVFAVEADQAWNDVSSLARDLVGVGLLADAANPIDIQNLTAADEPAPTSLAPRVLPNPPNR